MGQPPLNCQNDDTPHVFPSQGGEREFIAQELSRVQQAGNGLAEAAHHVSAHFDGVHRLRLALADWYTALANEGGRGR